MIELDGIDRKILTTLQRDGALSQRDVASKVGLSQNACWRRIKRLNELGVIEGYGARLNAKLVGLDLTVFMMIKTRRHSECWQREFRVHVATIPEIVDVHRIGGDWDYLIKVVTSSMSGYDKVYKQLTSKLELETVTGLFAMETILENQPLSLS
ncbi:Lrp/AsnC family transcriptional regulator [bacterium]|jgi:Lrp/AsnC family transcriptional regulator|nr:Lrp/AsnC family transcriptional regulator [Paracoccaceae bacterium]MDA8768194.1 Lrp/AsnC family transcriptional regulator [Planktomarina temperata]MDA9345624.1 Lrp/AsnC family transcriptional regulator [bacterium]HBS38075.1 ArsR family transcriptional regulator [Paracoccaceae bacterium]